MYMGWQAFFENKKKSSVTDKHPVGKYQKKIKINTGSASIFLKLL